MLVRFYLGIFFGILWKCVNTHSTRSTSCHYLFEDNNFIFLSTNYIMKDKCYILIVKSNFLLIRMYTLFICSREKKLSSLVKDRISVTPNFNFFILIAALEEISGNVFDNIGSITFSTLT